MRTLPLLLAVAAAAAAQTTHVVGPGGFASVNAALAAASPGDVVLVQPGTYPPFQAAIGVTVRASGSGPVMLLGASSVAAPASQPMHLVDLDLVQLAVTGGLCTLDRCRVRPGSLGDALFVTNARVHLQACDVGAATPAYVASGAGMLASAALVTAIDTTFRGRDRSPPFSSAGPGVWLAGATLHGSGLSIQGGDGIAGVPGAEPGVGVHATNTTVWICDSTIRGGRATDLVGSPPWACPLSASAGRLARCTLLPATCPPAIPTSGPLLGVSRPFPLQSGAPFQLAFRTESSGFVGVFASLALGAPVLPVLEQPVALDLATLWPLAVLVADGNGAAAASWTLPPGTTNAALWLQAAAPDPLPLPLSPVAGGVVR
jgi:hypothetical protein